jgi:hypothetical protein
VGPEKKAPVGVRKAPTKQIAKRHIRNDAYRLEVTEKVKAFNAQLEPFKFRIPSVSDDTLSKINSENGALIDAFVEHYNDGHIYMPVCVATIKMHEKKLLVWAKNLKHASVFVGLYFHHVIKTHNSLSDKTIDPLSKEAKKCLKAIK